MSTSAGGLLSWTGNGPGTKFPDGTRVVLQLNYLLQVQKSSEGLKAYVDHRCYGLDNIGVGIANLCSDGIGYAVDTRPEASEPRLFLLITE